MDPYSLVADPMDDEALEEGQPEQPSFDPDEALPAARGIDYRISWPQSKRSSMARLLGGAVDEWYSATEGRRENILQWRHSYEMLPVPTVRWEGASEIPATSTRYTVDSHSTRLNSQILRNDRPLVASPKSEGAIDAVPIIEEFMASRLEESQWQIEGGKLHQEICTAGNALLRVTWDEEYRRVPERAVDVDTEALEALIAAGMDPASASYEALKKDAKGRPVLKLQFRDELAYAGVRLRVIPFDDCVIIPATARDAKHALAIGERVVISGAELMDGARRGVYIRSEVDGLLGMTGDEVPEDRLERLDHQAIEVEGGEDLLGSHDRKYRNYTCYELCIRWDANDDGADELLWVTLHKETDRILRLQYMPYEHGEVNYIWFPYIVRAGELFGSCPAEVIAGLQAGQTSVINQIVDHGDLATALATTFAVDDSSGFDPDKFVLKMNVPIRFRDLNGMRQLIVPQLPAEHYNMDQKFKDMVDLVSGTSNPSLGMETDTQRTLGEVQIVTGNANAIYEEAAVRVALMWTNVWRQWLALEAQYANDGMVEYQKRAEPGKLIESEQGTVPAAMVNGEMVPAQSGIAFARIPAEVLHADVQLIPSGLKQLSDMNARVSQAMAVMNVVQNHPLTASNPEVQKIALEGYLQATLAPSARQIMDSTERFLAAQQAVQAAELQAAAMAPPGVGPQGAPAESAASSPPVETQPSEQL